MWLLRGLQAISVAAKQRRHDAIHAIFLAAVTAPVDGKRPEPVVNIIIDNTTFNAALGRHHLGTNHQPILDDELGQQLLDDAPDLINTQVERAAQARINAAQPQKRSRTTT